MGVSVIKAYLSINSCWNNLITSSPGEFISMDSAKTEARPFQLRDPLMSVNSTILDQYGPNVIGGPHWTERQTHSE